MLKCIEINQELITDINMHQMIEKGLEWNFSSNITVC